MKSSELRDLQDVGLTEGEAKVYIALLELGNSTVGPIVTKSGVAYSNIYFILNRLIEKGLVSFVIRNKTKYFQAASPHSLHEYLEKKENDLEAQRRLTERLISQLQKIKAVNTEEAEIFVGLKGLRTAYQKLLLDEKDEFLLFFYVSTSEYDAEADRFYLGMYKFFKDSHILMKGISNPDYKYAMNIKKAAYIKMRFVNFPLPGNIDIYGNKIFIVSWGKRPIGFLITSKNIADDMRNYFYALWKIAKK